jgi:hypothetical protein
MKSKFYTIGERINKFDNLEVQTVGTFNELFPECKVKDFNDLRPLEILEPHSNNSRVLNIDGNKVIHKMYENLLYNVNRDEYNETEEDDIMGHPV